MTKAELPEWERYPNTGRFLLGRRRSLLSTAEKQRLEALPSDVRTLADGEVLIRRGEVLDCSAMLVDGFMIRTIWHNNERSIVSLQVPGDFVDLHGYALKRLDHDLVALGTARVAVVPHRKIDEVLATDPKLGRLLWFSTLLDAAIHREWICKLEQLQAAQRVAHIFAELWHRLEMVGLGEPGVVRTPLTQANLAEMCGVTPIHMNRSLGQLRRAGIAVFRRGSLYVEDRARLEQFGDFVSAYLYGEDGLGTLEGVLD
ncbi:Crp/Fnr family transcriptional regulator [Erythrobacteraceae bacterium CFH 75059]|uniref:Crp/Fnr family transcriptional regulator n=1 Tax=Qipengyuania thermophila TaxID=2509361 RepID=UPI0010225E67|nr:Crp/Fnr family transcriptional regulator [Qipengyuania thermophila]TCD04819.1 Crp/Fnr family transcriptional regulator [Erythrobacteraceae bacterium CFH 75059]